MPHFTIIAGTQHQILLVKTPRPRSQPSALPDFRRKRKLNPPNENTNTIPDDMCARNKMLKNANTAVDGIPLMSFREV